MKFVGFLLLAVFASSQAISIKEIKEIEKATNSVIKLNPSARTVATRVATPTIGNDVCSENVLHYKSPNTGLVESKDCKVVTGATTGFCNCAGNGCQRTLPTNCPVTPASDCKTEDESKIFPNELKCDEYRICLGGRLQPGYCIPPLRYNSLEGRCTSNIACRTTKCPTTQKPVPVYVPFPNPRFYLSCFEGISRVLQCPEGCAMDKNGCSYQCTKSGSFADPDPASNKWYVCVGTGPSFRRTDNKCAEGERFDEPSSSCKVGTTGGA